MKHLNILVVEDEGIIALEIKKRLQKLGYTVPAMASSGKEAINKTALISPDLILMDIILKGEIDGLEASKKICEKYDIPIIHLTAHSDDEMLDKVKNARSYGYILKPFKEGDLLASIEAALSKYKIKKLCSNLNIKI